jgi:AraC family transcriptional regulator
MHTKIEANISADHPPLLHKHAGFVPECALFDSRCRVETILARCESVERVILALREKLDESLHLNELAEIAMISPCHLSRVFHQTTGIPLRKFQSCLRLEAAKRLLLTSSMSVTDICFEVGYNSLGTFTSQFTQLIGLSPLRLRQFAKRDHSLPPTEADQKDRLPESTQGTEFAGCINGPAAFSGRIIVGLFPTPIAEGCPSTCTILTQPGPYQFRSVSDGRYFACAVAIPQGQNSLSWWFAPQCLLVGSSSTSLLVRRGRIVEQASITLRAPQLTDPPILTALPLIFAESGAARE